jgi:methylenetetrahydrofolate dehydrogenase (NADP+)/methenyltetrahydrofolate cyclohydrolase
MFFKNIKEYVKKLKENFKERIKALPYRPKLIIFKVGDVEASNRYVRNKVKDCEEVGIEVEVRNFSEDITAPQFTFEITKAVNEKVDGIIIQLPLPAHLNNNYKKIIPNYMDVDGFNLGSLFKPATPKGIMNYLEYCGFDLCGKDVVIIGRSEIVGKPLARMMTDADATVTLCHSKSYLEPHIKNADLIICAVGKPQFLDCSKINVPVIDVGINFDKNGKLCGDCYNTEGKDITPVPGGVGLLTRCALLDNVISAKEQKCC